MSTREEFHVLFAELRSLMHDIRHDETWSHELCRVLKLGVHLDAKRYETEWLPYIKPFVDGWPEPLRALGADQFARWADLAPTSRLDLHLRGYEREWQPQLSRRASRQIRSLHMPDMKLEDDALEYILSQTHIRLDGTLDLRDCALGDRGAERLAQSPLLQGVRTLDLSQNDIGVVSARALCSSPYLDNLETLRLRHNRFSERAIMALCEPQSTYRLRSLDLYANDIFTSGLQRLAQSPMMSELRELGLGRADLDFEEGIAPLAHESSLLDKLERLYLEENYIDGESLIAFFTSNRSTSLRELHLAEAWFDDEVYETLAHRAYCVDLEHLVLDSLSPGIGALRELCRAAALPRMSALSFKNNNLDVHEFVSRADITIPLRHLWLDGNHELAQRGGHQVLVKMEGLERLETLGLSRTAMRGDGLVALAHRPGLPALCSLALGSNRFEEADFIDFVHAGGLIGLTHLDVSGSKLTAASVEAIASSTTSGRLESLSLRGNRLGDEAISVILASPHLARLHTLDVRGTGLGNKAAMRIAESPRTAGFRTLRLANNHFGPESYNALLDSPYMLAPLDVRLTYHHQFLEVVNLHPGD